MQESAVEVLFTGLDRGVEGGEEQQYARSLPLTDALAGDALLAYEVNGVPLPPQHGFPLRLVVPGWYGMASVKWLERISLLAEPFDGYQSASLPPPRRRGRGQASRSRASSARSLHGAARDPRVPEPRPHRAGGRLRDPRPRLVRGGRGHGSRGIDDGGETWAEAELDAPALGPFAWRGWSFTWGAEPRRVRAVLPRPRRGRERPAARAAVERRRLREQRGTARPGHGRSLPAERSAARNAWPIVSS